MPVSYTHLDVYKRQCQEIAEQSAGSGMDIREAVTHKEQYSDIVTYFRNQKTLSVDQLVLLIDTIDAMSPEIYEPVSYTHLDVYKRQHMDRVADTGRNNFCFNPLDLKNFRNGFNQLYTRGCLLYTSRCV